MVGNSISQMLVQDIVRICQTCGMACIAEGVETQEQAATLEKMAAVAPRAIISTGRSQRNSFSRSICSAKIWRGNRDWRRFKP